MMAELVFQAGDSSLLPWLGCLGVVCFLVTTTLPERYLPSSRLREAILFITLCATLLIARWPMLEWPHAINIDEPHVIACAHKATVDFAPWRGFDGTTSGPLNSHVLILPALFGCEINYFSARLVALGLIAGAVIALYYAVKWTSGSSLVARFAIVPPVLLLTLTTFFDFVHFTTEHMSIFLITVSLAGATYLLDHSWHPGRLIACLVTGLCCGAASFAKLQSLPTAAAAGVIALAIIWFGNGGRRRTWELLALLGSTTIVPLAFLVSVILTGELSDAIMSYITMARWQTGSQAPVPLLFYFHPNEYGVFFIGCIILFAFSAGAMCSKRDWPPRVKWVVIAAVFYLVSAFFSIYEGHRPYSHYLLFSVMPLGFLGGVGIALLRGVGLWSNRGGAIYAWLFFPAMTLSITTPWSFSQSAKEARPPEIAAIARHAKPGERMAVWGWHPEYYVYTKTIMATRDAQTVRSQEASGYRPYFRARYLKDLKASMPVVFVDGVTPTSFRFDDPKTQSHESFPELAAFIAEQYVLKEKVEGVRIFVRKDRA